MKNGRVEATMCNSNGVRALEFCKELFKTDRSWKYFADIKDSINFFCAGTSAMFASNLHFYTEIATKADFKLDYVHTPMGSDQNKYIDAVYDASLYMVPKTKEKQLDVIGNWINSIASISGKALNNESKKMTMNGLSNDAVNTYKWIMNNVQADYSTGAFSGTISSAVDGSVTTASKSPAKVMDSIKIQAQKELDDFYANMY
ncbi:MAG: hypothetical protein IKM39_00655 [Clostridia bacterium]|nr:hypothetical protein [Clostridia bacterium]